MWRNLKGSFSSDDIETRWEPPYRHLDKLSYFFSLQTVLAASTSNLLQMTQWAGSESGTWANSISNAVTKQVIFWMGCICWLQCFSFLRKRTIFFFCLDPSLHTKTTAVLNTTMKKEEFLRRRALLMSPIRWSWRMLMAYQMQPTVVLSSIFLRRQEDLSKSHWCGVAGHPWTDQQPGKKTKCHVKSLNMEPFNWLS